MTDLGEEILGRLEAERAWLGRRKLPEAQYLEVLVADVRSIIERWRDDALPLDDAADYSGLTKKTLQNKIAAGELVNAGSRGRPRVLRRDLPRRPRAATVRTLRREVL